MHLAIPLPIPNQIPNATRNLKASPRIDSQCTWPSQSHSPSKVPMQRPIPQLIPNTPGHLKSQSPHIFPMQLATQPPKQSPNAIGSLKVSPQAQSNPKSQCNWPFQGQSPHRSPVQPAIPRQSYEILESGLVCSSQVQFSTV